MSTTESVYPARRRTGPKPRPAAEVRGALLRAAVTPGEYVATLAVADEEGVSVSDYVRRLVLADLAARGVDPAA